jgi:hypothetical protein
LIFGVPIGVDALMWNVHRIYGKLRLPLLFKDWKEIEWLHYDRETQLNSHNHFPLKVGHQKVPEPVIVLSKK